MHKYKVLVVDDEKEIPDAIERYLKNEDIQVIKAYNGQEQINLRKEYLEAFRSGMRHHIEGMKVVDPEGNDVTPEKLKEIQKKKGLHNRNDNF